MSHFCLSFLALEEQYQLPSKSLCMASKKNKAQSKGERCSADLASQLSSYTQLFKKLDAVASTTFCT